MPTHHFLMPFRKGIQLVCTDYVRLTTPRLSRKTLVFNCVCEQLYFWSEHLVPLVSFKKCCCGFVVVGGQSQAQANRNCGSVLTHHKRARRTIPARQPYWLSKRKPFTYSLQQITGCVCRRLAAACLIVKRFDNPLQKSLAPCSHHIRRQLTCPP